MGFYINPTDMPKLEWIRQHMIQSQVEVPEPKETAPNHHWVAVIDNGRFVAAGIAYNTEELSIFSRITERPVVWALLKDDDLIKITPEVKQYLQNYI